MGLGKWLADKAERVLLGDPVRDQHGEDTELRDMAAGKPRKDKDAKGDQR